jgi:nitrite reductase/ring-hydroxylating ferredoxin subunit
MPGKISRRDFIVRSATGVVIGSAALSFFDVQNLFAGSARGNINKAGSDMIIKLSDPKNADLAKVNGSVLLDDDNILIRISQTQFLAVNLICRHKGCTVDLTGGKFVCPCHGSEYDIKGKVTQGPSKKDLKTWPTIYDPDKGVVTVKMDEDTDSDDHGSTTPSDTTKVKK